MKIELSQERTTVKDELSQERAAFEKGYVVQGKAGEAFGAGVW